MFYNNIYFIEKNDNFLLNIYYLFFNFMHILNKIMSYNYYYNISEDKFIKQTKKLIFSKTHNFLIV